ncbi:hypothetical protein DESC_880081 [Desulfosarcina cetonica]|nr:hypothetical protein DESC_880081 [Desulfosarcina cetonica]
MRFPSAHTKAWPESKKGNHFDPYEFDLFLNRLMLALLRRRLAGPGRGLAGAQPGADAHGDRPYGGGLRHVGSRIGGQHGFRLQGQKHDCPGECGRQQYLQHCPGAGAHRGVPTGDHQPDRHSAGYPVDAGHFRFSVSAFAQFGDQQGRGGHAFCRCCRLYRVQLQGRHPGRSDRRSSEAPGDRNLTARWIAKTALAAGPDGGGRDHHRCGGGGAARGRGGTDDDRPGRQ